MNPAEVRLELAAQLETIQGLQVHAYPPGAVVSPAAVVQPISKDPHGVYSTPGTAGMPRSEWSVILLVDQPYEQSTNEALDEFAADTGNRSILAVLESGTYTAFDVATVTRIEWESIRWADTEYLAGVFTLDIVGSGG